MRPSRLSNGYLAIAVALVMTLFFTTSCVTTETDEPPMPNNISVMGCWGEQYTSSVEGAGVSLSYYKFDNTTYTKIVEYSDMPKEVSQGKYRRENKTLTLNWANGYETGNEVVMTITELTNDKMVLQYNCNGNVRKTTLKKMTETEFNSHVPKENNGVEGGNDNVYEIPYSRD